MTASTIEHVTDADYIGEKVTDDDYKRHPFTKREWSQDCGEICIDDPEAMREMLKSALEIIDLNITNKHHTRKWLAHQALMIGFEVIRSAEKYGVTARELDSRDLA